MRFLRAPSRQGHIEGAAPPKPDHVSRPAVDRTGPLRISGLTLGLAGFLGCVICLAWNALHDRRYPEQPPDRFGFGRPATIHEIDSEAIAIPPTGRGLPQGSGDSLAGAAIYQVKCAACHGATGREGPYQKLVGDTGKVKTIGNYWPYATTVFDYVRRAMPLNAPGTLTSNEVYGLTAWLLSANKIISPKTILDARTLPGIEMPAKKFYVAHE
jgi:hypothetical protein